MEGGRAAALLRGSFLILILSIRKPTYVLAPLTLTLSEEFLKCLTFREFRRILVKSENSMSDGPHRSLPMGRKWKKLAECVDNASFSVGELRERRDSAILGEFSREIPNRLMSSLREVLSISDQGVLIAPSGGEIEYLRPQANGTPVGNLLLDCLVESVSSGQTGEGALIAAFSEAATEILNRQLRGMAEHYQREARAKRAIHFQSRLGAIHDIRSMESLARRIVQGGSATVVRAPTRYTGLDDGVRL